MRAIGYVRVSTHEQETSGLGIEAQRTAILAEVANREDWTLERVAVEVESTRFARVILDELVNEVRERSARGEHLALVVRRLDRLGRDVAEIATLIDHATKEGWELLALSPRVDMTDPFGRAMAHMAIVFSQLERDLISMRTKEALAAAKARGVKIGRRPNVPPDVIQWLVTMRSQVTTNHQGIEARWSLKALAEMLTADGVPTAQGGRRWYASTVQHVLRYYAPEVA